MLVLVTGAAIVLFLRCLWPLIMSETINEQPIDGGEKLGNYVGIIPVVFVAIMWTVFVLSNPQWGWFNPEPAITSIVATVAIIFGYVQWTASPYLPAFELANKERTSRLNLQRAEDAAVKLVVHNTGIASWGRFRISLEADTADGIIFWRKEPNDKLSIINDDTLIQMNAEMLAVGEPASFEFNVKAAKEGEFRLRVRVATGLRSGEKQNTSLRLIVSDAKPYNQ